MYDSMVFYRSFYEAIKDLETDTRAEIYDAIFAYGLDGIENDLSPIAKAIFTLVKPQIDANNKRKENGKKGAEHGVKGGRPAKENPKETPNEPLDGSEETPNVNANVNANVNENVNGNVNVNENANVDIERKAQKHIYGEYKHVRLTDSERDKLMNEYGETEALEAIRYLDEYIEMKGYKAKSHYLAIRKWVFDAVEKEKRKNGAYNALMGNNESWANSWANA